MLSFKARGITLLDINRLIDSGRRFTLVTDEESNEDVMSVEEYLNETEVTVSDKRVCERGKVT